MSAHPQAFFLPAPGSLGGQRYGLYHAAKGPARGAVVYVHPFAEELNKTRRMAALGARALADSGYAVLQIDLFGCGDSSGDFGDASWSAWVDDVVLAAHWLAARVQAPLWLWGLRAGCLLARQAAPRAGAANLLFWHPVLAGKPALQQFLRLRLAGDMVGGGPKESIDALRATLAAGTALDVAGYRLSPAVALGLGEAALEPCEPLGPSSRVEWIDVSARPDAGLSAPTTGALSRWERAGWSAQARVVVGPAFWASVEIQDAPALVEATIASLREPVAA